MGLAGRLRLREEYDAEVHKIKAVYKDKRQILNRPGSSFELLLQKPKGDFPDSFRRAGQGRNAGDLYGDAILRSSPFDC